MGSGHECESPLSELQYVVIECYTLVALILFNSKSNHCNLYNLQFLCLLLSSFSSLRS